MRSSPLSVSDRESSSQIPPSTAAPTTGSARSLDAPEAALWRTITSEFTGTETSYAVLKSRLLMLEREGANRERGPDRDGRAEVRAVSLLRRSGRLAAVSSGLAVGDRVIVYPSDRIASGARVASR